MSATAAPSFYVTGGTLRYDAPSYVERQADRALYEGLSRGEFCYILTSRQMGKSSLMVRTAARLREDGIHVAILDLTAIGQNLSPEQWYEGLLDHLGQQLDLEDELEAIWEERAGLGPLQRWMTALREVVLGRLSGRVVIFVDEIDAVRSLPFSADEFFAAIRECYTHRAEDPEFNRLTFCLLGVASPTDLIRDTRITPFNIGRRIDLTDFTEGEAAPLAQGLAGETARRRDGEEAKERLRRILYWTGGHPYLTQRLCQAVAAPLPLADSPIRRFAVSEVDRLCDELFLSAAAREKDDNLLFVRERLLKSEADLASLLDLYRKVRAGKLVRPDDTNPLIDLLRLAGITRLSGERLAVRNRIYERVFDRDWVTQHMPDAELRRQAAAFRRGLWRAGTVAGLVIAVMAGLTFLAARNQRAADIQAARARRLAVSLRGHLYASQMNLAYQAAEEGNLRRALALLEAQQPEPGQEDLRGFEWRYVWRLCQGDQRAKLTAPAGVQSVVFSPDGRTLATASEDKTVKLWDVVTQRPVATLQGHHYPIWSVAFSPNGKILATGTGVLSDQPTTPGEVKLWDVTSGRDLATLQGHKERVRSVVFSPDGKLLTCGGWLWDVASRRKLAPLQGRPDVGCAAFSPDGRTLATAGMDSDVKLWDVATRRQLATLQGPTPWINALALSPDGKTVATASMDSTVRLWDVAARRQAASLKGHRGIVRSVAFSRDGKMFASGGDDASARLWNIATRRPVAIFKGHTRGVSSVAFSPISKTLATASGDRTVRLWDVGPKRDTAILRGHTAWIWSVAFSPDGKILATASNDRTVKLWDAARGREVANLSQPDWMWAVAFSPDGKTLATGSKDKTVRLWDVASWRAAGAPKVWRWSPSILKGHTAGVNCVAFSPRASRFGRVRKLLASAAGLWGHDVPGELKLWDAASKREIAALRGHTAAVDRVAFSPDGRTLASQGMDNTVRLWDVASRREVARLSEPTGFTGGVEFSPDGRSLATGIGGGLVALWDATTKRKITRLQGTEDVDAVAFSPDGQRLATTHGDGTVRLWNPAIKQEVAILKGHSLGVSCVAFSPDGNTLATAGADATVRLWRAAPSKNANAQEGHEESLARD